MRAQVSLELFFAVSLFLLVLFWLNHFLGTAAETADSQRLRLFSSAAQSFAADADAACLLSANVTFFAPCAGSSGAVLNASGKTIRFAGVAAPTRCAFLQSEFPVFCDQLVCVRSGAGGAVLQPGPCEEA